MVEREIELRRNKSGDSTQRIALSLGVDGTVVVKGLQYVPRENAVVGGAYPYHWLVPDDSQKSNIKAYLEQKRSDKTIDLAAEAKFAVMSFQHSPAGMCPYVILAGLPQTLNMSNSFAHDVMDACVIAAKNVGNAVILNDSTDGVSCEKASNFDQQRRYLLGETDQLSYPDTNHNIKNVRYQLTGGSGNCPSVFGSHVFDPMLLKLAGVQRELYVVDDWASDSIVLQLASANVVRSLLELETPDIGNKMVSCMFRATGMFLFHSPHEQ